MRDPSTKGRLLDVERGGYLERGIPFRGIIRWVMYGKHKSRNTGRPDGRTYVKLTVDDDPLDARFG